MKVTTKSEKLEQKLAVLREHIAAAKKEEAEAGKAELLRLIDRAGCLPEALHWARAKAGRRARAKHNQQEVQ